MNNVYAEIITIGDEILYGQISDTNSQWISSELDLIGIKTRWRTTVGDNEEDILNVFKEAKSRANLILITGGLGPTSDDLTKPCLAKFFNCELVLNDDQLKHITELFKKFGRELSETNKHQAELPEKCKPLTNPKGSAPGMWFEEDGKIFVSMPGVPREMKHLMRGQVIPGIKEYFPTPFIKHKIIKTIGIGESYLSDKIKEWENNLPLELKLAYLPGLGDVKLRLTCIGARESEIDELISIEIEKLKQLIGVHIYGYDKDTLAGAVGNSLRSKKLKVACAESCTGGNLSKTITSVAGSSDYFQGCVIPYHNQFKSAILNVNKETLFTEGAVSENTVIQLADNVKSLFEADIGISTSGVAGPAGGTEDKPVGTVWIGLAGPWGTHAKRFSFGGDREANIHFSTLAALFMLWQRLLEID
jgi:nicotinamide-nucleotide amidase